MLLTIYTVPTTKTQPPAKMSTCPAPPCNITKQAEKLNPITSEEGEDNQSKKSNKIVDKPESKESKHEPVQSDHGFEPDQILPIDPGDQDQGEHFHLCTYVLTNFLKAQAMSKWTRSFPPLSPPPQSHSSLQAISSCSR
jgi:hypothetical protein